MVVKFVYVLTTSLQPDSIFGEVIQLPLRQAAMEATLMFLSAANAAILQ